MLEPLILIREASLLLSGIDDWYDAQVVLFDYLVDRLAESLNC